jgi:hypothetical protein
MDRHPGILLKSAAAKPVAACRIHHFRLLAFHLELRKCRNSRERLWICEKINGPRNGDGS